jgi:coronin-1B/1C/6
MQGGHSEQIQSVVFNYDGGVMATSAKDQRIRLWDPRSGAKIDETVGHETPKASRLAWLGNSTRVLSTGFHKSSEREFMIFDTRNFSKPLTSSLIGTHTTHTTPRDTTHDTHRDTRHDTR